DRPAYREVRYKAREAGGRPTIGELRGRQRGETRRGVDRHPTMAGEPHLDPRVRVVLAHYRLVEDRVVIPGRVAGGQARRDAEASQHQRLRGGELLAVADLRVEQKPI